jgi:hypothetical protein
MNTQMNWNNMIKKFLVLLSVLLAFGNVKGQSLEAKPETRKALIAIAQQLLDALGTGDTTVWSKHMAADCIVLDWDGNLRNRSQQLRYVHPLPPNYFRTINIVKPVIVERDNTAVMTFMADERVDVYGQPVTTPYNQTDTYVNIGGQWKLLASMAGEIVNEPITANVSTSILQKYTGTYELGQGMQCTITLKDGRLIQQKTGRQPLELLPETETVFFAKGRPFRSILFITDTASGKVVKLIERRAGNDIVWKKIN